MTSGQSRMAKAALPMTENILCLAGSKLEIQPCLTCPLAFSFQQTLIQPVLFSHLPQLFSSLCSGNHLHSGKHCSEDHRLLNFQKEHFHFHCTEDQVQEQLSDQTCSSHQAEIQEKEDSKLLFRRIIRSSASKAISSPLEEQTVTSKEDNTVVDIGPSLAQRTDLEETDKICALEISRFGAIKYGEFGLGFIKESNQLSLQKTHTRETAYMYTE